MSLSYISHNLQKRLKSKIFFIYTAMVAGWRSIAYRYTSFEDEVGICIMSLGVAVVKSGYPLEAADERWLAEGHEACYALDVPQDLRVQQHKHYYAGCYYRTYLIRSVAYANPR
jgi:hypothetical protein